MKKTGRSGWGQKPDTKLSSGWLEELKKSSQSIKKSSQLDATATVRVVSVDDQKCTLTDGDTEMSFELTMARQLATVPRMQGRRREKDGVRSYEMPLWPDVLL